MIIKEIYLISFGKFHNKKVSLKRGLNLIYGGNESGKTTMHKFIEGMFFGFFKPYSKNKLYTPDYLKYTPWNGQEYKGVIVYEKNGRRFRLERVFSKAAESVKLFDDASGADVSEMLDFDFSYKMPKANKHIPINNVLFKNTVSIGQLANITDKGLVKEISDLFADTSGTHSSGVSLKAAIDQLEKRKEAIGSASQPKTALGKEINMLMELEEEKKAAEQVKELNKQRYKEIRQLESELEATQQQKGEVSELREKSRLSQNLARFEKYSALQRDSEALESAIKSQADISESLANEYEKASIEIEVLDKQLEALGLQKNELEIAIDDYQSQLGKASQSIRNFPMEEMLEDKAILDNSLKKIEALTAEKQTNEDTTIESRYDSIQSQRKLFSLTGPFASIISIFAIILYFPLDNPIFLYIGIPVGVIGLVLLVLWYITNQKSNLIEDEFEKYDTVMSRTMNMLLMCELDIEQFRAKYSARNNQELIDILGGSQNINARINEIETQASVANAALADLNARIAAAEDEKSALKLKIGRFLEEIGAESEESFRYAALSIKDKAVARARLAANRETMETVLAGMTLEQLEEDSRKALSIGIKPKLDGGNSMEGVIEQSSEEILRVTSAIAALKATIAESENSVRGLNEITEEMVKARTHIAESEAALKSYNLAIEKIELLSSDIHHTFADAFNDYVSSMISEITKGKYTRVRVNDKMQIKVEDQELGQLIDISSLSGGTIDQLYFCVRFAIMDLIIKDKTIPVFLDDCMLQYDDSRLSNILNLLYEKSKDRQIIIFSCRKAEKLALDEKNYYYNFVNLSKPSPQIRQPESSGGLVSRS